MDLRPFYFNALENTGNIISGVSPAQLDASTPCEGWDTRRLMNHIVGGVLLFGRALSGEQMSTSADPGDLLGKDPSKAFSQAQAAALESWNGDGVLEKTVVIDREMPASQALRIALMEAVVHGWDLAKATDQKSGIDPMVAAAMLDGLRKMITPEVRAATGVFGPEVSVPEDAPIEEQLVAFLGRKP